MNKINVFGPDNNKIQDCMVTFKKKKATQNVKPRVIINHCIVRDVELVVINSQGKIINKSIFKEITSNAKIIITVLSGERC